MSMDDVRNWYLFFGWTWFFDSENQPIRHTVEECKLFNLNEKTFSIKLSLLTVGIPLFPFQGHKRKVSFYEILTFFPSCQRNAKGQPTRGKWCIGKQQYMKKEHVWEVKFFSLRLSSLED